jgi:hypothetical protein
VIGNEAHGGDDDITRAQMSGSSQGCCGGPLRLWKTNRQRS